MRHILVSLFLVGVSLVVVGSVSACDSTSCALVTRGQNGVFGKRGGRVDLSFLYVNNADPLSGRNPILSVTRPKVDLGPIAEQPLRP